MYYRHCSIYIVGLVSRRVSKDFVDSRVVQQWLSHKRGCGERRLPGRGAGRGSIPRSRLRSLQSVTSQNDRSLTRLGGEKRTADAL